MTVNVEQVDSRDQPEPLRGNLDGRASRGRLTGRIGGCGRSGRSAARSVFAPVQERPLSGVGVVGELAPDPFDICQARAIHVLVEHPCGNERWCRVGRHHCKRGRVRKVGSIRPKLEPWATQHRASRRSRAGVRRWGARHPYRTAGSAPDPCWSRSLRTKQTGQCDMATRVVRWCRVFRAALAVPTALQIGRFRSSATRLAAVLVGASEDRSHRESNSLQMRLGFREPSPRSPDLGSVEGRRRCSSWSAWSGHRGLRTSAALKVQLPQTRGAVVSLSPRSPDLGSVEGRPSAGGVPGTRSVTEVSGPRLR